jgi:hypothetical protein
MAVKSFVEGTYAGDDSVTVARGDEILHFRRRRLAELTSSDEVACEVELCGVAAGSAIGVAIELRGSTADCVGHLCNDRGHVRSV